MIIAATIALWLAIGFLYVRFTHEAGDWIIMITDTRNTPRTWMTWPSLILCWLLWPISGWVARHCFYLSITNLPRPKVELEDYSSEYRGGGSKVTELPDGEFLIDYDFNSMYWHEMRAINLPDKKDDSE